MMLGDDYYYVKPVAVKYTCDTVPLFVFLLKNLSQTKMYLYDYNCDYQVYICIVFHHQAKYYILNDK